MPNINSIKKKKTDTVSKFLNKTSSSKCQKVNVNYFITSKICSSCQISSRVSKIETFICQKWQVKLSKIEQNCQNF